MKQLMKSSAMVGLTTLSSLMATGTASADTQDLALHEKGDDVKMEAWRTDVARVEAENAQAEADAKNAAAATTESTTTTTALDDSEKREAMEERNRVLRNQYHEKYRDYMDAVNEGRTDVPEPTKPVYETMLPTSKASKATSTDFTIVRWDEKALPNGPQLEFYKEAGDTTATKPVTSTEAKPKGEALAEAPTPENALTLSEGLTSSSNSKEVAGDVPTPDNALANATEQKSKEAIGEAPTPEKAEGADTHLDKKEDQTSKDTKAPTKTSSGDSVNTAKMDKNKLVKVRWVDASGKDLKNAESASPANLPTHGDIDGYTYVTARQDDKVGEVLYVFAKKSGDEVKASSKEAEQQAPAKQEAKQEPAPAKQEAQAPAQPASAQPAQTPSTNTQTSAPQAKPAQAQASAPQATKTSELPTTGDAGSILSALSVFPAALAGLALRKKRED